MTDDTSMDPANPMEAAMTSALAEIYAVLERLSERLGKPVDFTYAIAMPVADGERAGAAMTQYSLAADAAVGYRLSETLRAASMMRLGKLNLSDAEFGGMMKEAVDMAQRVFHEHETMEAATAASQKLNLRRKKKG